MMTALILILAVVAVGLTTARLVHTIRLDGYGQLPPPRSHPSEQGAPTGMHPGAGWAA